MKTTTKITFITTAVITLTTLNVFGAVHAKGAMHHRMDFNQLDTNSDGFVTSSELEQSQKTHFAQKDSNNDGTLNMNELIENMPKKFAKRMKRMGSKIENEKRFQQRIFRFFDENGDGVITLKEMPGYNSTILIKNGDKNGDGKLSKKEMRNLKSMMRKKARSKNSDGTE